MARAVTILLVIQLIPLCLAIGEEVRGASEEAQSRPAAGTGLQVPRLRFEKVSDHVHFLQFKEDAANVTAVSAEGGILMVNPPADPELQQVLEAVKRVAARPMRWVVSTDYLMERSGGSAILQNQGAALLASSDLWRLASAGAEMTSKGAGPEDSRPEAGPRISFTRQMRLFPENLEIRIIAVQHKARTAGDMLVFIPAEKVLITGDLFVSGSFPEIDVSGGEGSALGWIDGLKQAVDTVPLLKSAMPQPKPDPSKTPPEEKTLEEQITVIPGRGPRSNMQEMKDLLEAALKLRAELTRAIGSGRSRESALSSSALAPARSLGNFESFAARLFDEIAAQRAK
jgi:glyoxylase-like metal-dependent hydrolase (beta-lactamase superfamily II)